MPIYVGLVSDCPARVTVRNLNTHRVGINILQLGRGRRPTELLGVIDGGFAHGDAAGVVVKQLL